MVGTTQAYRFAFGLTQLLTAKMAASGSKDAPAFGGAGAVAVAPGAGTVGRLVEDPFAAPAALGGSGKGKLRTNTDKQSAQSAGKSEHNSLRAALDADFLVARCEKPGEEARVSNIDGLCLCALPSADTSPCQDAPGATTICIEDFRRSARRRTPVCGLEVTDASLLASSAAPSPLAEGELSPLEEEAIAAGLDSGPQKGPGPASAPALCPSSYVALHSAKKAEGYVCKDAGSVWSCGEEGTNCLAPSGVARAECRFGSCNVEVCKEGYRLRFLSTDAHARCVSIPAPNFGHGNFAPIGGYGTPGGAGMDPNAKWKGGKVVPADGGARYPYKG